MLSLLLSASRPTKANKWLWVLCMCRVLAIVPFYLWTYRKQRPRKVWWEEKIAQKRKNFSFPSSLSLRDSEEIKKFFIIFHSCHWITTDIYVRARWVHIESQWIYSDDDLPKENQRIYQTFFAPFPFIQLLCVWTLKYNNGIESEDENFTKSARLSTSDDWLVSVLLLSAAAIMMKVKKYFKTIPEMDEKVFQWKNSTENSSSFSAIFPGLFISLKVETKQVISTFLSTHPCSPFAFLPPPSHFDFSLYPFSFNTVINNTKRIWHTENWK